MTKENKPTHAWGIAGLILGILGLLLFLAPYIGIVLSITAIVFYNIQKKHGVTGAATGGLVTGIIGVIINGIILLFIVGALVLFSNISSSSDNVNLNQVEIASGEDTTVDIPAIPSTQADKKVNPKTEYIQNYVKLEDVEVSEGYGQFDVPGYDKKKPTVQGKIRNTGNQILDIVKINVYFLDSTGIKIGEKEYNIISTYSIMGDNTPLKPNYVRDWGYVISDAPSGWDKRVEVVVSDITFGED